ncbi:hypothetical protein COV04_00375 [Candidatus Uhrbacteria bacterium CG10_big_fil_rev_8_21_14_0_10_48_11]|uniref:Uncharacterized protein n=1 Tax=Candidatus Uhrbacteria bacterium CG10_big_fil_rev_8_21_14_0_10_48_11 TaxID=1975037 RepID=A0A2M8LFV1_9BACT|nr:MAG: hypothetical protein COV04_00375 [Candidatus Uhrbacteria bacterium CG10_big_fil_rev_8_21_14_0_10_48_11]
MPFIAMGAFLYRVKRKGALASTDKPSPLNSADEYNIECWPPLREDFYCSSAPVTEVEVRQNLT